MEEFLRSGIPLPTAFLCANEDSAIGPSGPCTMQRSPSPVRCRGCPSTTPPVPPVDPPLTSVSTHVDEMARTALRLLVERAALPGKQPVRAIPLKVVVPPL